jgi:PhnB protein
MNQQTNRASSSTARAITPHLVVGGAAQAADWYQQAFGAQVGARIPVPGGKFIQIEVRVGDATVMLADEFPDLGVLSPLTLGGTYGALDIATEDADALWDRAVAAGATVHQPLQDMFWGDRHGQLIDPFGHRWGISQHLRDVPLEEVTRAAAAMLGHVAQLVGAWVPSSNWPTDQFQGIKPVRLRVRPATEGTQPHHRRETFLYTLKAGPAGGAGLVGGRGGG